MLNLSSLIYLMFMSTTCFLFVYLKSGCKNIFQNDFSCGWEEPYSVLLEKTVDNNPTDLFRLPNPKYLDGVIESLLAIR